MSENESFSKKWYYRLGVVMALLTSITLLFTLRKDIKEIWEATFPQKSVSSVNSAAAPPPQDPVDLLNSQAKKITGRSVPPVRVSPEQIRVPDAYTERWFAPLHWYVRDRNGSYRFFIGAQEGDQDTITGAVLTPVTPDIVHEVQQRQDEDTRLEEIRNRLAERQQKAGDAQRAIGTDNYELALENCPSVDAEFHPDPCEDIYHEAAGRKARALVNRSKLEIQNDKLNEAIRDAKLALRVEPDNEAAKRVLALAESLERAEGGPKQ